MGFNPSLNDVQDEKSVIEAQKNAQITARPLRTSQSASGEKPGTLTTYGLSDALQGVALFKPPGIAYDAFNQELSKELQDLGTEPGWTVRDSKLTPYDVFVKDPDPSKAGTIGRNAAVASGGPDALVPGTGSGGATGPVGNEGFVFPGADGKDGWQVSQPWSQGGHPGVDLIHGSPDQTQGTPILAAKAGTAHLWPNDEFQGAGNMIQVDHGGGLWTMYMHMVSLSVEDGAMVTAGQEIGRCGSTGLSSGPHLHFEVHKGIPEGDFIRFSWDPYNVNPMPYIGL